MQKYDYFAKRLVHNRVFLHRGAAFSDFWDNKDDRKRHPRHCRHRRDGGGMGGK